MCSLNSCDPFLSSAVDTLNPSSPGTQVPRGTKTKKNSRTRLLLGLGFLLHQSLLRREMGGFFFMKWREGTNSLLRLTSSPRGETGANKTRTPHSNKQIPAVSRPCTDTEPKHKQEGDSTTIIPTAEQSQQNKTNGTGTQQQHQQTARSAAQEKTVGHINPSSPPPPLPCSLPFLHSPYIFTYIYMRPYWISMASWTRNRGPSGRSAGGSR